MQKLRRAVVSVADRRHLQTLVGPLLELGVDVLATPGTAAACADLGLSGVRELSAYTGVQKDFGGRVLSQHPRIHAGISLREDELDELDAIGGLPIDLVAVNFGSLVSVAANPRMRLDDVLGGLDIDGPSLIRAAAQNHERVAVLVDPNDYGPFLHTHMYKKVEPSLRAALAQKALVYVARYDAHVAEQMSWFERDGKRRALPAARALVMELVSDFAQGGDNARQAAAFYAMHDAAEGMLPDAMVMSEEGEQEPTFQEAREGSLAIDLLSELSEPSAALVGRRRALCVASGDRLIDAVRAAGSGIRPDARGLLLATSHAIDEATSAELRRLSVSCVLAPTFEALPALRGSGKKLIAYKKLLPRGRREARLSPVLGGLLVQDRDASGGDEIDRARVASARAPEPHERRALELAWIVAKHATSDAAVVARTEGTTAITAGIGSRAVSPVAALEKALAAAGQGAAGAALALDLPLDGPAGVSAIELAARAGIRAIAHPGGHDDAASIAAADRAGLAFLVTGVSHRRS